MMGEPKLFSQSFTYVRPSKLPKSTFPFYIQFDINSSIIFTLLSPQVNLLTQYNYRAAATLEREIRRARKNKVDKDVFVKYLVKEKKSHFSKCQQFD